MSEDKYTREGDKRFTLRIEKKLFAKLELSAKKSRRSIGRQIEYIIDKFLNFYKKSEPDEVEISLEELLEIPEVKKAIQENKKKKDDQQKSA